MELGATVCGPNRKPECGRCPCREFCGGHLHGTAEQFPVKKPKSGRKTEKLTVFILRCDGQYALQKRPEKGLLAGLWQFPNVSGHLGTAQAVEAVEALGLHPRQLRRQVERQHIFTHIQWEMRGYYLDVAQPQGEFEWLTPAQITGQAALPTAFRQFWEEEDYV
jgi:A/G-specific adenine glycosylase